MQGAADLAVGQFLGQPPGRVAGGIGIDHDPGRETRLEPVDSAEAIFNQFERRDHVPLNGRRGFRESQRVLHGFGHTTHLFAA